MRALAGCGLAFWVLCSSFLSGTNLLAEEVPDKKLPTVVLLGDSIRLSYTPVVVKELGGKANVISPKANGGDSSNLLKNIDAWAVSAQPDVVHFNCGIHDVKKFKATGKFQVSPAEYEANLRAIVERLRGKTQAKVLFALTTPLIDERAAKTRADRDYELLDASAEQYNAIALRVMKELDVPVNDLRAALGSSEDHGRYVGGDGVHFNAAGVEKLGTVVATFVSEYLPSTQANK